MKDYIDSPDRVVNIKGLDATITATPDGGIRIGSAVKIVDLFGTLAALTGRRHPPLRFPRWLMIALAAGLEAGSLVTRRPPLMTIRQASRFVGHYGFYSSDKAERELGYTSRPGAEALARTVSWFLASDLLSARHKRFLAKRMPNA